MKRSFLYLWIFLLIFPLEGQGKMTFVANNLDYKKIKFHEHTQNCDVTGNYPQFKSLRVSAEELKGVNKELGKFAGGLFKRFLSGDDIGKQVKEDLKTDPEGDSFDINFKVTRADTKYVSVIFDTYFMPVGGPHGVGYFYAFNYDIEHSRTVQLRDLFKPGTNYLKQLDYFSNLGLEKKIGTRFYTKDAVSDGTQFTFDKRSLTIHYNAYEVACYAAGMPKIRIPFKKLKWLIETVGKAQ